MHIDAGTAVPSPSAKSCALYQVLRSVLYVRCSKPFFRFCTDDSTSILPPPLLLSSTTTITFRPQRYPTPHKTSPGCGVSEASLDQTLSPPLRQNRRKGGREENHATVQTDVRHVSRSTSRDVQRTEARRLCRLGVQAPAVAEGRGREVGGGAAVVRGDKGQDQGQLLIATRRMNAGCDRVETVVLVVPCLTYCWFCF